MNITELVLHILLTSNNFDRAKSLGFNTLLEYTFFEIAWKRFGAQIS